MAGLPQRCYLAQLSDLGKHACMQLSKAATRNMLWASPDPATTCPRLAQSLPVKVLQASTAQHSWAVCLHGLCNRSHVPLHDPQQVTSSAYVGPHQLSSLSCRLIILHGFGAAVLVSQHGCEPDATRNRIQLSCGAPANGCPGRGLHLRMHNHRTLQAFKLCPESVLTCMRSPK